MAVHRDGGGRQAGRVREDHRAVQVLSLVVEEIFRHQQVVNTRWGEASLWILFQRREGIAVHNPSDLKITSIILTGRFQVANLASTYALIKI